MASTSTGRHLTPTHERFREFVRHLGGDAEAARAMGVDRTTIHHIRSGRRMPGLLVAFRIEQASRGWLLGPLRISEWVWARALIAANDNASPPTGRTGAEGL